MRSSDTGQSYEAGDKEGGNTPASSHFEMQRHNKCLSIPGSARDTSSLPKQLVVGWSGGIQDSSHETVVGTSDRLKAWVAAGCMT